MPTAPTRSNDQGFTLPSVCDIPWRAGFRVGSGVDAVTGAVAAAAVEPFWIDEPRDNDDENVFIDICRGLDVVKAVSPALRESPFPALEPLSLRAWSMARAVALAGPFPSAIYFLVSWSKETSYVAPSKLKLTNYASSLLADNATRFRERYGDYLISIAASGKQFTALVTLTYDDEIVRRRVEYDISRLFPSDDADAAVITSTQLKGNLVGRMDAKLSGHTAPSAVSVRFFARNASDNPEEVDRSDLRVMEGKVFATCYAEMQRFAEDDPQPIIAQVEHYTHYFKTGGQRTIPLTRAAQKEMNDLQAALDRCSVAAIGLPAGVTSEPAIASLRDEQRYAVSECLAQRESLSISQTTGERSRRQLWIERLEDAEQALDDFATTFTFWRQLVQERGKEPGAELQTTDTGRVKWSFGRERSPNEDIEVDSETWQVRSRLPVGLTSDRPRPTRFEAPIGTHIIGWTVEALRKVGSWRCDSDAVILEQEVRFVVWPGAAQSSLWKFTVYYASHEHLDVLAEYYGPQLAKYTQRARRPND